MFATESLARDVHIKTACEVLGMPRASYYYYRKNRNGQKKRAQIRPPLALTPLEEQNVLVTLHTERYCDKAPRQVYATLLDEGTYLCSVRTMYRILGKHDEVRERRNQLRHPQYQKPELLATAPKQVWSWDITKLKGPAKWTYFYLFVILDIFSRYVVGWVVAHREQAILAQCLIADTCQKQAIKPKQLVIHADRGSSMKSKPVAFLLSNLGITKSHSRPYASNDNLSPSLRGIKGEAHSRPYASNDNPYSESQFKTLKYRPDFPGNFSSVEDVRLFCKDLSSWYNTEHYHSGIGLHTGSSSLWTYESNYERTKSCLESRL